MLHQIFTPYLAGLEGDVSPETAPAFKSHQLFICTQISTSFWISALQKYTNIPNGRACLSNLVAKGKVDNLIHYRRNFYD